MVERRTSAEKLTKTVFFLKN